MDMPTINYKTLLEKEAKNRKWTPEQVAVFEKWRNNVGQVESNNNPTIQQIGGGPGRGKYQYELKAGGSGANIDAVTRLKRYLKKNGLSLSDLPYSDHLELMTDDPDFSKLSSDTQDMIFLADKSLSANTPLNDLVSGTISPDEAWAQWHWKGSADKKQDKLDQWQRNVEGAQTSSGVNITQPIGLPDLTNKEDIKRVQKAIGVKADGVWGDKSKEAWKQTNDLFVTDTYRQEGMQRPAPKNTSLLQKAVEKIIPSAQAEELPVRGQPTIPQQAEPQYATMEDLLMDKGLMRNPLLFDNKTAEQMWRQF